MTLGLGFDIFFGKKLKVWQFRKKSSMSSFEKPISRERGVTTSAQGGALTSDECCHQVRWPKSEHVSHTRHSRDFSLFPMCRRVRVPAADRSSYLPGFLVWYLDLLLL